MEKREWAFLGGILATATGVVIIGRALGRKAQKQAAEKLFNFSPPLALNAISSGWDMDRGYRATSSTPCPRHRGVDFSAGIGTDALAIFDGTITSVGSSGPCGVSLTLTSTDGDMRVTYCHLKHVVVPKGTVVSKGQRIALTGDTGAGSAHLHLTFRFKGKALSLYKALFGSPITTMENCTGMMYRGFPGSTYGGETWYAVPGEPLVPGASYSARVAKFAEEKDVVLSA